METPISLFLENIVRLPIDPMPGDNGIDISFVPYILGGIIVRQSLAGPKMLDDILTDLLGLDHLGPKSRPCRR